MLIRISPRGAAQSTVGPGSTRGPDCGYRCGDGVRRGFFDSGAFGAMLLWFFFILILPTIMGLHDHNDAFAFMEDKAERFCDCCRSPLACIFGTLAAILLIPALLLPVIQFTRGGALGNMAQQPEQFANVPSLASSIGSGAQNRFFGGLASSFVWLTVIILPVLALILFLHLRLCRLWRDGFVQYSKPVRLLHFIFPFCYRECARIVFLPIQSKWCVLAVFSITQRWQDILMNTLNKRSLVTIKFNLIRLTCIYHNALSPHYPAEPENGV